MAATLEIDAVIDPAQTREWLVAGLEAGRVKPSDGHLAIDTW
jgi:acetyl-CoA carboxylase carboxyltransferase component